MSDQNDKVELRMEEVELRRMEDVQKIYNDLLKYKEEYNVPLMEFMSLEDLYDFLTYLASLD